MKERLFNRINSFLEEVDRDRTALQTFNDIVISLSCRGTRAGLEVGKTDWIAFRSPAGERAGEIAEAYFP
jgi:hypothetical protein